MPGHPPRLLGRAGEGTRHPHQSGQAIVLIALMLTVLIGMVAIAIDGSRAYTVRRDLQNQVIARVWQPGSPQEVDLLTIAGRADIVEHVVDCRTRQADARLGPHHGRFVLEQQRH